MQIDVFGSVARGDADADSDIDLLDSAGYNPARTPSRRRSQDFRGSGRRPASAGTRASTAWDFRATTGPGKDEVTLPLLQLDYDIAADLRGSVPAGSRQRIGLSAFQLDDARGAGKVRGATLQVSYDDGETWRPVVLKRDGVDKWRAAIKIPKRGADFLSLGTTAWDAACNEVKQEVIRTTSIR